MGSKAFLSRCSGPLSCDSLFTKVCSMAAQSPRSQLTDLREKLTSAFGEITALVKQKLRAQLDTKVLRKQQLNRCRVVTVVLVFPHPRHGATVWCYWGCQSQQTCFFRELLCMPSLLGFGITPAQNTVRLRDDAGLLLMSGSPLELM